MKSTFVVGFVLLAAVGCAKKPAREPILIGQIVPLSGPEKTVGIQAERGAHLAVQTLIRTATRPVSVLHVDGHGEANSIAPEAVRLVRVNHASALVGGSSPADAAILARTARDYSLPAMTTQAPPAGMLGDLGYCVGLSAGAHSHALARLVRESLKLESVVVIADGRRPADEETAEAFVAKWENVPTRPEVWSYRDEKEWPEIAGRIKRMKEPPQAVFVAASARDFAQWRVRLEADGLHPAWVFGGDELSGTALRGDREASRDVYFATAYLPTANAKAGEFAKEFRTAYQTDPDVHAALAYDAVRILSEAMLQASQADPAKLREFLDRKEPFESTTGPLVFGKDHTATRPVFVARWQDDGAKVVLAVEPVGDAPPPKP